MLNGSMGEPSDDNVTDMSELEGESLAAKEAHKDGARQCAVKENWQVNKKVKTPRVHLQGADEDAQMVVLKMMMMVHRQNVIVTALGTTDSEKQYANLIRVSKSVVCLLPQLPSTRSVILYLCGMCVQSHDRVTT